MSRLGRVRPNRAIITRARDDDADVIVFPPPALVISPHSPWHQRARVVTILPVAPETVLTGGSATLGLAGQSAAAKTAPTGGPCVI